MRFIYSFFTCFFLLQLKLGFAHVNDKLFCWEGVPLQLCFKIKRKKNSEMPFSRQEQYLPL